MDDVPERLLARRHELKIGVREAAKLIGVGHATISRIERGKNAETNSYKKIINWLDAKGPSHD